MEGAGIDHDRDIGPAPAHRRRHLRAPAGRRPVVAGANEHEQGPHGELADQRRTAAGIEADGRAIPGLRHQDPTLACPLMARAIDERHGEGASVGPADDADVIPIDVTARLEVAQRAHAIVEALGIHDLGRGRRAVFRDPSRGPAVHDEREVAALLEPATPLPRRRQHTLTAVEQYHGGKRPGPFRPVDLPRHLSRHGGRRVGKADGGRGAASEDQPDNREPDHARHGFQHTSVTGTIRSMKSPVRAIVYSDYL